jgi:WD40 repeat protein
LTQLSPKSNEELHALLSRDVSGLWMAADVISERSGVTSPILVLIDQFEEAFGNQVPGEDINQFVRLLVRFFERPHPNVYLIVTMRTDFLDICTKFAGLASVINGTQFLTPILGLHELIEAIRRPSEDYGGEIEKPLLDRLLLDMRPGAGYDPDNLALLQHALQWLWRRACARNGLTISPSPASESKLTLKLDLPAYTEAGGLRGILNLHANEVLGRFKNQDQMALEVVFKRLAERTSAGGYRRTPARISNLSNLAGSVDAVRGIVNELCQEDIEFLEVRTLGEGDDSLVDICHEALIRTWDRYRGWVDQEAEKLRLVRRVVNDAVDWQQRGRRDEDLLHGHVLNFLSKRWSELSPTKVWAERYAISQTRPERLANVIPLVESYFDESNKLNRKEVLRFEQLRVKEATARIRLVRDRLFGAVLFLCVIAAFLGYRYWTGDQQARELVAGSFRVLAEDALVSRHDAPTALLWIIEGLKRSPGFEDAFEPLLYEALQELRLRKVTKSLSPITSVSFSPDTKFFVSAHQDAKIRIWSIEGGVLEELPIPNAPSAGGAGFSRVRWSPNGEFIAIAARNGVTILYTCSVSSLRNSYEGCKRNDRKESKEPLSLPFEGQITAALFSPDSEILLVQAGPTFFQASTMLYEMAALESASKEPVKPVKLIDETTWAAAFSFDSDQLAVGARDGGIHLISGAPKFEETSELRMSEVPPNGVWSLAFAGASGDELYSGHADGSIYRWDSDTHKPTFFRKQSGQAFQLVSSKDGKWIASSSANGYVSLWAIQEQRRPPIALGPVGAAIWNLDVGGPAANWILAPSSDSIFLWNRRGALAPTEQLAVGSELPSPPLSVTTNESSYSIHFGGSNFDLRRPLEAKPASVAARNSTGDYFAVAEDDGSILVYRARSEDLVARLRGPPQKWKAIAFDGPEIIAISEGGDKISWPFFQDRKSMIEFATKSIPLVDNRPMQLDPCILVNIGRSRSNECQAADKDPNLKRDRSSFSDRKLP